MSFCIEKNECLPDAIQRIAVEQLVVAAGEVAGRNVSAASIHNARKAIKRARAVLRLLRCNGNTDAVKRQDCTLRDAGRILAKSRDTHIQLDALKQLSICRKSSLCRDLIQRLSDQEKHEVKEAGKHLSRFTRAIRSTESKLPDLLAPGFEEETLALALEKSYRRSRKCYKRVRKTTTGKKLHEWRKTAKTFSYHLDLLAGIAAKKLKTVTRNAHQLTDYLGDDHDLFLLLQALTHATGPDAIRVKRELRKRRSKLQKCAFKVGCKTFDLAPPAFHRRISRYLN